LFSQIVPDKPSYRHLEFAGFPDELLFEAPHKEIDRLRVLVREAMEKVHQLAVPLVADLKAGPNRRDMK
jgi:DNA polymerase I-like protein with 3'-5' exonuclease and polymerase domains